MSQVYLRVNTAEVQRNIDGYGTGTAASAVGCINQLQEILDRIEKTAMKLEGVWDDDAQRVFMERFLQKRTSVSLYFGGLKAFLEETSAAVETVKQWDEALAGKLRSL